MLDGPKPAPAATTRTGFAAASAAIAAGSARGSPPCTGTTAAPATWAVAVMASATAESPAAVRTATWLSGDGTVVAGSVLGAPVT